MVSIAIGENSKKKKCKSWQELPFQAHIKQLCFSGNNKKNHGKKNHPATTTKHNRIIIIINLWQATLRPFRSCRFAKKEETIQYGYMKMGTHTRVFSQTLEHGNNKNEIRERKDEKGKNRGLSEERSNF